jgi:hypothetical protein
MITIACLSATKHISAEVPQQMCQQSNIELTPPLVRVNSVAGVASLGDHSV